jgi:hypothetical protein
MKMKLIIKILILSVICIHYLCFAVNEKQQVVISTVGSSVTAGIIGYSQDEVDDFINYGVFTRFKKRLRYFTNYLYTESSIADKLTTRTINHTDKIKIINSFNAFNESNKTYFYYIKMPNIIALHLYQLINDPLFYLMLQINHAIGNNANVILGIDMMFWIIYSKTTDEQETETIEISEHKKIKTLKKLLDFLNNNCNSKVSFILGNIPQVSFSSLGNYYAPDPAIIDYANHILQQWVISRNHSDKAKVMLTDITKVYKTAKTDNKPFKLHKDMPDYTRNDILSIDDLHLCIKGIDILLTYIAKNLKDTNIEIFQKLGSFIDD